MGKRWTLAEEEYITSEKAKGSSVFSMAQVLGRTGTAVIAHLKVMRDRERHEQRARREAKWSK